MKKDRLYAVNKGNSSIINGNLFSDGGIKFNWNDPFAKANLGNTIGGLASMVPDSMYNTLDPMYHIAGGRESGVGNALNSAGVGLFKVGASTGNAPLMIAGAAAKVGGGLYNTLFGTKWNQDTINNFNRRLNSLNSFNADTSSNDAFMASVQNNLGPMSRLSKSDVGKDGLFTNKVSRKTNELNTLGGIANSRYSYGLNMGAFNTDKKNDARMFASSYAFGGPMGALEIMQNDKYINAINNRSDALAQKGSVFNTSPQLGQSNLYPDGGLLEAAFVDDFKKNPMMALINYNRGLEQLQAERESNEIDRVREQEYLDLQNRMNTLEADNIGLQIALNNYQNQQPIIKPLESTPVSTEVVASVAPNDTAIMARMRKSLMDRGVSKRAVQDAVIANMMVESGGNPNAKNPKSSARGLMQWTTPRHPKAWDWDSQVDHIVNTLESGFGNKKAYEQFMNTNDSTEAARLFRQYWERPEKHTYNWTDKYINQMYNMKAFGGELGTNGTDFTNGLLEVNEGGTHSENPLGGVPLGLDPQGQPNLVEEGETIFNDYVNSNRLLVPEEAKKELGLGGYINKDITFADASKVLAKESEERPNDPISMNGLRDSMNKLAAVQEEERMRQQMMAMEEGLQFACGGKKFGTGGRKGRRTVTEDEYSDSTRKGMGNGYVYYGAANNPYSSPLGILQWINDASSTINPDQMVEVNGEQVPVEVYTGVAPMPSRYPGRTLTRAQLTNNRQAFSNSRVNARTNFKATKNTPKPQQKPVKAQAGSGMKESVARSNDTSRIRPADIANTNQAKNAYNVNIGNNYPNQAIGVSGVGTNPYSGLETGSLGVGNFNRAAYLNRAGALGNQAANFVRNNWQDIAGYGGFGLSTLGVAALAASQRGNTPMGEDIPVQTSAPQATTNNKQTPKKAQRGNTPQSSSSPSQAAQNTATTPNTNSDWRRYMNAPILTLPAFNGYNGTPYRASDVPIQVASPTVPTEPIMPVGNNGTGNTEEVVSPATTDVVPEANVVVDSNGNYTTLPSFWGKPTYAGAKGINSAANTDPRYFFDDNGMHTISGYLGPDNRTYLAGLAPDNLTENAAKRWQDAYEKSDYVKDKAPYDTWMRYAPVVGAGIMSLTDALGLTNKPDYTYTDRLEAAANRAGYSPDVEFNPIGDYMTYKPMDINYGLAQLGAASRANARDIQNVAGTRGGAMAGMLANGYNSQIGEGNLYRQALEYNDALERQVADFNRGTNQFNSQMGLRAAIANAQFRQGAAQAQLSGLAGAYGLRDSIDQRVGAARTANITNLLQGLGNIGTENFVLNQIYGSRAANRGLYAKPNGMIGRDMFGNLKWYGNQ